LNIFRKSVKKIQVSLKSDNSNGTAHEDRYTFMNLPCSIFQRNISDKTCRGNHKIPCISHKFFSKNLHFVGLCGKILHSRTGYRWKYGTCALHAGYLRLPIHTHIM